MGSAVESPTDPPILRVIITTTTTITLRIGTNKATSTTEPPTPHTTPCHAAMHNTTARPLRAPALPSSQAPKGAGAMGRRRRTSTGAPFRPTTKPVLTDTSDTETGTDRRAPPPLVHRGTIIIAPPSPRRPCARERKTVTAGRGRVGGRVSDWTTRGRWGWTASIWIGIIERDGLFTLPKGGRLLGDMYDRE
jgi:hypothetical protein